MCVKHVYECNIVKKRLCKKTLFFFCRGLLSGHILAEYLQQRADIMPWYRGELLDLAKDLGYRFLPAFNTTTGIPYGRVRLLII